MPGRASARGDARGWAMLQVARSGMGAALLVAIAVAGMAHSAELATPASPAATVRAFYAFHLAHDMAFTLQGLTQRAAWLTPDLVGQCRSYLSRPSPPDEAPEIDGDPFTDTQEYPTAFGVGKAEVSGATARVPVRFRGPGKNRRTVHVELVAVRGSWLIDDIRYESGTSLRALLAPKH